MDSRKSLFFINTIALLILLFFTLTQGLLFFDDPYKFGFPGMVMFLVSIFVTLFVRLSHAKRKKEIRMGTF